MTDEHLWKEYWPQIGKEESVRKFYELNFASEIRSERHTTWTVYTNTNLIVQGF